MSNTELPRVIVVAGDVNIDWNLARSERSTGPLAAWAAETSTCASWQRGGAALLADLVTTLTADQAFGGWTVRQMNAPMDIVNPSDPRYHHAYSLWYQVDADKSMAWRVQEFLGLDRCHDDSAACREWLKVVNDTPDAALVLLDDADLGYRRNQDLWPAAITTDGYHPWVVLKMAQPVAEGDLWHYLLEHHAQKLILVTTVNDLRRTSVQISRELSWERTAQDVVRELVQNRNVADMSRCAATVISFGPAGAVVLTRSVQAASEEMKCELFFDPPVIEGMWEQAHPGNMLGYTTCLVGGIVVQTLRKPDAPDLRAGVQAGLSALRLLHLKGYANHQIHGSQVRLGFPFADIAASLVEHKEEFAVVPVLDTMIPSVATGRKAPPGGLWSILHDRCCDSLDDLAREIVVNGPAAALHDVPLGQFGKLLTVDRQEIESLRSIRALIAEYCGQEQPPRPLNIAVFGTPGSGKSFGVWEAAQGVRPGQMEKLEFNLSQLTSPDDLLVALHRVRDVGLAGKIPLAFWDEFDATLQDTPLGWLRYFLAPMQDGKFLEGQLTHPIGRAIFVFAGGTSATLDEFNRGSTDADFRNAKGPDFVSRLKGYVNVMGPNRRRPAGQPVSEEDPYYVVRRAFLLRAMLKRDAKQLLRTEERVETIRIDEGVLRAFLKVREYKHGARSMESIIGMSLLAGKVQFEQSSLPSKEQLDLHVDGLEFLARVRMAQISEKDVDALAQAYHQSFYASRKADGWKHGDERDDAHKIHPWLVPFAELPLEAQEANRAAARAIPDKLAIAGYIVIPNDSGSGDFVFPVDDLERMSEYEHERWMQGKFAAGYRHGTPTAENPLRSQDLVPWAELPEEVRKVDRDLVRAIPGILAQSGYRVVKVE